MANDKFPPNLKILTDILRSADTNPTIEGLLAELAIVANQFDPKAWEGVGQESVLTKQTWAREFIGPFNNAAAIIYITTPGGSSAPQGGSITLERCTMPGCGRLRMPR